MKYRVGFAGMGLMGRAMAANLAKAGHDVAVWNRTRPLPEDMADLPACDSPFDLAGSRDVLLLMVTGPDAVDAVLWGERGMGPALGPGKTVVNMSTVAPAHAERTARKVEAAGAAYLDAPVSGSEPAARQASLVVLAGGPEAEVRALTPLFLALGKKVVACGETPRGSLMKMSANLLLAGMMESLAEAVNFGMAGGLTLDSLLDVVQGGPMACDLFRLKEPLLRRDDYPAQFPLKHMVKDLKFVADTAFSLRCPAPGAYQNLQLFTLALAKGLGEEDFSAVRKVLRNMV